MEPNYIRVDEDDMDETIYVYDCTGEISNTFEGGTRTDRRRAAEEFAKRESARINCEWGANYNPED